MSSSKSARQLKHSRSIVIEAYVREDGLWDIEATLCDRKTRDVPLASGVRPAGQPVHLMTLRVTIDTSMTVRECEVMHEEVPYPGFCDQIGPSYAKLVGLNLLRGFRQSVHERLGGVAGCTHLTELAAVLPTAAVQAFAGEVLDAGDGTGGAAGQRTSSSQRPFQIDRCHALRSDGEAVRIYYPQWYRPPRSWAGSTD